MSLGCIPIVLVLAKFLQLISAQEAAPSAHPVAENHSVELNPPVVTTSTVGTVSTLKRNDWWPATEQEIVTQTSPYATELQQPVPPTYYVPAPAASILPHYRSDHWTPYGYPEFGYPVLPPHANNQIAVPTKYMTVALFIGLLTLFAIIQGAMMVNKQKESIDANLSRRRRDLLTSLDFEHMTPEQHEVLDADARIRCIQRTICQQNRQLRYLGAAGGKLANYLTRSVEKSLRTTSGWDRLAADAGAAGLRGDDCDVLYRDCVLPFATGSVERRGDYLVQ